MATKLNEEWDDYGPLPTPELIAEINAHMNRQIAARSGISVVISSFFDDEVGSVYRHYPDGTEARIDPEDLTLEQKQMVAMILAKRSVQSHG